MKRQGGEDRCRDPSPDPPIGERRKDLDEGQPGNDIGVQLVQAERVELPLQVGPRQKRLDKDQH